jgi:hypothetical protein
MQGRSSEADSRFTVHGSWERAESDADGRGSFAPVERSMSDRLLAHIVHEDLYWNRRHAAATSLTEGGLAAQSINILCQVCLPPSRLHAPVSPGVSAVSSRTRE